MKKQCGNFSRFNKFILQLGFHNFHQDEEDKDSFQVEEKEDVSSEVIQWVSYYRSMVRDIANDRFSDNKCLFDDLEEKISIIRIGDIVAIKMQPKKGDCGKFNFAWTAPFVVLSTTLNSAKVECLHTRRLFSRNFRLIKKLNLDSNFSEMLRKRDFVIKNNFFYPTNTENDGMGCEIDEIFPKITDKNSSHEKVLRNNKKY